MKLGQRLVISGLLVASSMLLAIAAIRELVPSPGTSQGKPSKSAIPVVIGGGNLIYLAGGWTGTKWSEADKFAKSVKGGESYRLFARSSLYGTVTGSKPKPGQDPPDMDQFYVDLGGSITIANDTVGIGGTHNPKPRAVEHKSTTQVVYLQAVSDILRQHKLMNAKPLISRIVRVDLDGDGEPEVLIEASNTKEHPRSRATANQYSFVALRKVVKGKVQTTILEGDFHAKADPPDSERASVPSQYGLLHILDLNGDGIMEVVTSWRYYEGDGYTMWALEKGKLKRVLGAGGGV